MNQRTSTERQRPRWACFVHNLGDDLRWALSAWCDFPRPVRRVSTALFSTGAAWVLGVDDALSQLVALVTG